MRVEEGSRRKRLPDSLERRRRREMCEEEAESCWEESNRGVRFLVRPLLVPPAAATTRIAAPTTFGIYSKRSERDEEIWFCSRGEGENGEVSNRVTESMAVGRPNQWVGLLSACHALLFIILHKLKLAYI